MKNLIDIVILWVDDNDDKWLNKKKLWQETYGIIDNAEERYRSWDNLQYLFRGIEKYAPWVNHIFLVTDNQRPEWLDGLYSKVTVVDHTEIIDKEYLPTFNSSAIELNVHKIKNLSEKFIYFNDDTFIINKTLKEDFFINGVPKDRSILNINIPLKDQRVYKVIYNNLTLINDSFDKNKTIKEKPFNWFTFKNGRHLIKNILLLPWEKFPGFYEPHLCFSYTKKTFNKVWSEYEEELLKTTKDKFRKNDNYNQWLMRYWQLASNNFVPGKDNLGKNFTLSDSGSVKDCSSYIRNQKGKIVCVNDGENLSDFNNTKNLINSEFKLLFPNKSKFEK